MDLASWTVIAVGVVLLAAIGASFRSLRAGQRELGEDLRRRITAAEEAVRRRC